jgi:hypothetical protein
MSLKKRIPLFFFISTFSVWVISLVLVYLPISPWSGPVFPKAVDPGMVNIFLISTVLSFSAALVMGLREFFNKSNLEADGKNLFKTKNNRDV